MIATIYWVILTAARDRLFGGLFLLLALSTSVTMFLGHGALIEQLQMAVVFTAGAGRFILVLGLLIFAAFHIQRMFETREIEAILSRAISRPQFVFAYWLGLAILATMISGLFAIAVALIVGPSAGVGLWAATLVAECIIVMAVTVFAGLMLERATSTVLFVMGFYALARLMGFLIGIRETTTATPFSKMVKHTLDLIVLFVPRLDLFAQTKWIVYGADNSNLAYLGGQAGLFLALVLVAATFDIGRKQF